MSAGTIRWWVFFTDSSQHRRWWYRIFPSYRGAFRHVYAICEIAPNILMHVDPQKNALVHNYHVGRPSDHIRLVQRAGGRVLFVEFESGRPDLETGRKFKQGCAITCTSVIAYMLGLDTRAVLPSQLWRVLVSRYGAKEVENVWRWRRRS